MDLNRTEVVNRTERPNSFEFGKAGRRHKVYYDTKEELTTAINNAIAGEKHLLEIQEEPTPEVNQ